MTTPALSGKRSVRSWLPPRAKDRDQPRDTKGGRTGQLTLWEDAKATALCQPLVDARIHLRLIDIGQALILAALHARLLATLLLVHRAFWQLSLERLDGPLVLELLLDAHLGVRDDLFHLGRGMTCRLWQKNLPTNDELLGEVGRVALQQQRITRWVDRDRALACLCTVGSSRNRD